MGGNNINPRTITYPYIIMNHLAMMLTMLKHGLFFPKQAERLYGCPISVLPPAVTPDSDKPLAVWYYSRDTRLPIRI